MARMTYDPETPPNSGAGRRAVRRDHLLTSDTLFTPVQLLRDIISGPLVV